MARKQHLTLSLLVVVFLFLSISYFFTSAPARERLVPTTLISRPSPPPTPPQQQKSSFAIDVDALPSLQEGGDSIAPKLENATLKAELGRATWRFLHTMVARFPDKPTQDERKTLETFVRLFGRLYPCGDCARHFRSILAEYPPQTSSRTAAAGWMCFVHNLVNKRLEKPTFDCEKIGDFYDCGCAEDGKDKEKKKGGGGGDDTKDGKAGGHDTRDKKAGNIARDENAGDDAKQDKAGGGDAQGNKTAVDKD